MEHVLIFRGADRNQKEILDLGGRGGVENPSLGGNLSERGRNAQNNCIGRSRYRHLFL